MSVSVYARGRPCQQYRSKRSNAANPSGVCAAKSAVEDRLSLQPKEPSKEEEEEEEEEGLFKADAVNEEDPERDRATQV